MMIAPRAGLAPNVLNSSISIFICKPKGSLYVKPPRRLRCPAVRFRPGGPTKRASTNIPPSWFFSELSGAGLPASSRSRAPSGVHGSGGLWHAPGVSAAHPHRPRSLCCRVLWHPATGQLPGGGSDCEVSPRGKCMLGTRYARSRHHLGQGCNVYRRAVLGSDGTSEQLYRLGTNGPRP